LPEKLVFGRTRSNESEADSTVGSMHSGGSSPKHVHHSSKHHRKHTATARSGSITESFVDANGVKKLVLETGPKPSDEASTVSAIIADTQDSNEDTSGTVTPAEEQQDDNDKANGDVSAYHSSKAKPKKKKKKAKKNSISF